MQTANKLEKVPLFMFMSVSRNVTYDKFSEFTCRRSWSQNTKLKLIIDIANLSLQGEWTVHHRCIKCVQSHPRDGPKLSQLMSQVGSDFCVEIRHIGKYNIIIVT